MEATIIINVSPDAHIYRHGALGTYIVPPATPEGPFGMLVVRPQGEIQDVGSNNTKRGEPVASRKIAEAIIGSGAESMVRRGLLICAAEPEEPRELERAERDEREFLARVPGEIRHRLNPVTKIREFRTVREPDETREQEKLALHVQQAREKFENECRKLVKPAEVARARANRVKYLQEMVQEGDLLWSREVTRIEVNNQHKQAAAELGAERIWAYTPAEMADCPACGQKVKKGIAICGHCNAVLDDAKARQYKVGPYKETAAEPLEQKTKAAR